MTGKHHAPDPPPDLPHSRACGIHPHPHGAVCAPDCPTCEKFRVALAESWRNQ